MPFPLLGAVIWTRHSNVTRPCILFPLLLPSHSASSARTGHTDCHPASYSGKLGNCWLSVAPRTGPAGSSPPTLSPHKSSPFSCPLVSCHLPLGSRILSYVTTSFAFISSHLLWSHIISSSFISTPFMFSLSHFILCFHTILSYGFILFLLLYHLFSWAHYLLVPRPLLWPHYFVVSYLLTDSFIHVFLVSSHLFFSFFCSTLNIYFIISSNLHISNHKPPSFIISSYK